MARNDRVERAYEAIRALWTMTEDPDKADSAMAALRRRFASPAAALETREHLIAMAGIPENDALLLSLIPDLSRYTSRERFGSHPVLANLSSAAAFLKTRFTGLTIECFYLLCLDKNGRMQNCLLLSQGTTNAASFYARNVLSEVVRTHADALIISHNHPAGTLRPSEADIACTIQLLGALLPLGVALMDHIIIAGERAVSLRETSLIDKTLWDVCGRNNALYPKWADTVLIDTNSANLNCIPSRGQ